MLCDPVQVLERGGELVGDKRSEPLIELELPTENNSLVGVDKSTAGVGTTTVEAMAAFLDGGNE